MVERLKTALQFIQAQRFYILFGSGASDYYVNARYIVQDFEVALAEQLRELGFRRTVFWSAGGEVYFRDPDSAQRRGASQSGQAAQTRRREFCIPGPLGNTSTVAVPGQPAEGGEARRPERAYDAIALGHLDNLMRQPEPQTAIVVKGPETIFQAIAQTNELRRLLENRMNEWAGLSPENLNVCIFVFATSTYEQLIELVKTRFPSLPFLQPSLEAWRADPQRKNVAQIGTPERKEIERLVDYVRLCLEVDLDWQQRDTILRSMAAQPITAATWLRHFKAYGNQHRGLDLTSLRDIVPPSQENERLNALVGLQSVKQRIVELENRARGLQEMRAANRIKNQEPPYLHMIFSGNPGTGKSTVAELIGQILADIGVLERGHYVRVVGKDLLDRYEGHTVAKVNATVDRALGGVLLIDEAYQLVQGGEQGFGKEAIDALVDRLSRDRRRLVVIAAGYTEDMKKFLEGNPGLPSRFQEDNRFEFTDYTPGELWQVLARALSECGLECPPEIQAAFHQIIERKFVARNRKDWGNAREMVQLADRVQQRYMNRRLGKLDVRDPLTLDDIPESERLYLQPPIPEVDQVLAELNELVGLKTIKDWVRSQVYLLRFQQHQRKLGGNPPRQNLNMVFSGNPGTGKTTVAKRMGEIFKALDLLTKGHVLSVRRGDLVAEFEGQTAPKTTKLIEEKSLDGILFIDEAYSLARTGAPDVFGTEAIEAIMGAMDKYSDRLVVIAAGYTKPMQRFLDANLGLGRRFGERVVFPDYSDDELIEIMRRMVAHEKFPPLATEVEESVKRNLRAQREAAPDQFGNAGAVELLLGKMRTNLSVRVMSPGAAPLADQMPSFIPADVPQAAADQSAAPDTNRRAFALVPLLPQNPPASLTSESVGRAVVFVDVQKRTGEAGSGSGVLVTPRGHCLTAFHVVEDASSVTVTFETAPQYRIKAEVLGWDKAADIAVLKLDGDDWPWVALAPMLFVPKRGQPAQVIGYPFGDQLGRELSYKTGTVSSLRDRDGVRLVEIDAAATHGSSGAPVFGLADYRVIGIIHGGREDVAGFNFAIDIQEVYLRFSHISPGGDVPSTDGPRQNGEAATSKG